MLPDPTVPASLLAVLELLRGCFTAPTFTTFSSLVTGLIVQTGRCTVDRDAQRRGVDARLVS